MHTVSISKIIKRLQELSPDQLASVYEFVSDLAGKNDLPDEVIPESLETMLASEVVLRRAWDRPEEDVAWRDL